jgi:nucleoid DNA-binding protein
MNKTDVIDLLAKKLSITKVAAGEFLEAFQDIVKESLGKGTDVVLTGFLTAKVKHRAARTGRNPQTGKPLQIAASNAVSISAGKTLKEFVKASKSIKKK